MTPDFPARLLLIVPCIQKFSDAEMLKAAGCKTPHEYLDKYLTAGEIKTLEGKISELSGFDQDLESLVDEVKN